MRRAMRVRLRSSQRSSSAAAKVTRIEILCNVLPDICNVRHCCMCLGGASPPPPGGEFFFSSFWYRYKTGSEDQH